MLFRSCATPGTTLEHSLRGSPDPGGTFHGLGAWGSMSRESEPQRRESRRTYRGPGTPSRVGPVLTLSPTIPLKRKCSGQGEASGQGLALRKAARGVNGRPWPDLGALEQAAATLGRPGERRSQESGGPNMAAESAIERERKPMQEKKALSSRGRGRPRGFLELRRPCPNGCHHPEQVKDLEAPPHPSPHPTPLCCHTAPGFSSLRHTANSYSYLLYIW